MDLKTILLVVALGGTNALQALGFTVPAERAKAEVTANADFMQRQLDKCLENLQSCYASCQHASSEEKTPSHWLYAPDGNYPENWASEAPYPELIK